MAGFEKFKRNGIGGVLGHNNRTADDGIERSNEKINPAYTRYNVHLKYGKTEDVVNRVNEIYHRSRKDAVYMGEVVVTLPHNVMPEDETNFFKGVYNFFSNDFGAKNIINAVIHKDETSHHIHIDFVPVKTDKLDRFRGRQRTAIEEWMKKNNINPNEEFERLCAYEILTRDYFFKVHQKLQAYMNDYLGYEVEILNGATENGNLSILQLKAETLSEKIANAEQKLKGIEKDYDRLSMLYDRAGISVAERGLIPLCERILDLENKIQIYERKITENDITMTNQEIQAMKAKQYHAAESAYVNYYSGSMSSCATIENDAVLLIEINKEDDQPQERMESELNQRNSLSRGTRSGMFGSSRKEIVTPQKQMLDRFIDLKRQAGMANGSNHLIVIREANDSERLYIFFKTNGDYLRTMEVLKMLDEAVRNCQNAYKRRFYLDKIETDIFDVAKTIFERNHLCCSYFMGVSKSPLEKIKDELKDI